VTGERGGTEVRLDEQREPVRRRLVVRRHHRPGETDGQKSTAVAVLMQTAAPSDCLNVTAPDSETYFLIGRE